MRACFCARAYHNFALFKKMWLSYLHSQMKIDARTLTHTQATVLVYVPVYILHDKFSRGQTHTHTQTHAHTHKHTRTHAQVHAHTLYVYT